ncbi:chloride channel protein [Actinomycetospora endophytica]|uniref:Chloride channel protein n=1 Tax=Actinomycetospora endophytica TaxID=2291215 RepID=A0ABS8P0S0_9PSEU|nr:chloride channel protein [Actinomycetospora endophytica]MCD2191841.1 chloride channel protein [Actinomycetospora endophytica]
MAAPAPPLAARHRWSWSALVDTPAGLGVAAVVVGVGAGAGAVVFRYLIYGVTLLATGQQDYAATPGAPWRWWPAIGPWFLLVVPVVGGLLYGPLVYRWAREARGHGVPEVMLAVAEHDGRIRPRVAVVKSLASALCIGTGGSVGREGPIVQIGSALGSSLGRWMRVPASRLRLLVACGAAGGISATFNAPIAGVFFALEIILLDFSLLSFLVVVTASAVANAVAQAVEGAGTFLVLPPFRVGSPWEYGLYAVVGLVGGLVGIAFTRTLYGAEDLADHLWRGPEWLRPAVGGVLLGLLLIVLPQMYGVGYPVLQGGVAGAYAFGFLLVLLVGKLVATSLTLAIGGSGGIFAPSLFLGAMAGTALGDAFGLVGGGPAGAYGLVGMAAVLAGATRAPITAVVIVAEITGEWDLIVPLMIAVVLATVVSRALSSETIYTLKLTRRGIHLHPPGTPRWSRRTAGEAAAPASGLDGTGRSLGTLRWSPVLAADRPLGAAADDLAAHAGPDGGLPVLSADRRRVVGVLRPDDLVARRNDVEPDHDEDPPCVVELPLTPTEWTPPAGFTLMESPADGPRMLLGPHSGLERLADSLPRPDQKP